MLAVREECRELKLVQMIFQTEVDLADEAEPHKKAAEKALPEANAIENNLPEPNLEQ